MAEVLERWCRPGRDPACEVHKCPAGWGPQQKMCLALENTPVQCPHCDHKAVHGNFVGSVTQKQTWKIGEYLCPRTKTDPADPALVPLPIEERDEYHFAKWAIDTGRVKHEDFDADPALAAARDNAYAEAQKKRGQKRVVVDKYTWPVTGKAVEAHECPDGWTVRADSTIFIADMPPGVRSEIKMGMKLYNLAPGETCPNCGHQCRLPAPKPEEQPVPAALPEPHPAKAVVELKLYQDVCKSLSEMCGLRDEAVRQREALRLEAHKAQQEAGALQVRLNQLQVKFDEAKAHSAAMEENRDYWYNTAKERKKNPGEPFETWWDHVGFEVHHCPGFEGRKGMHMATADVRLIGGEECDEENCTHVFAKEQAPRSEWKPKGWSPYKDRDDTIAELRKSRDFWRNEYAKETGGSVSSESDQVVILKKEEKTMPTTVSVSPQQKPVKFPRIKRALRWGRKLGYAAALLWMGGYMNEHGALGLVLDVGNAYRGWMTAMANDEEAGEFKSAIVCAECASERDDAFDQSVGADGSVVIKAKDASQAICPKCGCKDARVLTGRTIYKGTWPFTDTSTRFEEKRPDNPVPILPAAVAAGGGGS